MLIDGLVLCGLLLDYSDFIEIFIFGWTIPLRNKNCLHVSMIDYRHFFLMNDNDMIDLPVSAVSRDQTPKMYISKFLKIRSV